MTKNVMSCRNCGAHVLMRRAASQERTAEVLSALRRVRALGLERSSTTEFLRTKANDVTNSSGGVFTIDFEYDRQHASDGRSRFRAYVSNYSERLRDAAEDGDVRWALEVWRVATSPFMLPGFIQPRAGSNVIEWRWDGDVDAPILTVDFAVEDRIDRGARQHRTWYRNYRDELEPPETPAVSIPSILPIVRVQVTLDWERDITPAPKPADPLYPAALWACRWLVGHLNEALDVASPILQGFKTAADALTPRS